MLKIIFLFIFPLNLFATAADSSVEARKMLMPKIEGKTLFISGKIDSHIYNYLAYEYKKIEKVSEVKLNSLGGSSYWGIRLGEKIKELGLDTKVDDGDYCASACIYLFGAGVNRRVHENVWLGLHGSRLGQGAFVEIEMECKGTWEMSLIDSEESLESCRLILEKWYALAKKSTDESFDLMERAGVSPGLREFYYGLDEEADWFSHGNVLRIRDLMLSSSLALEYGLATHVLVQ